jgi:hypothetical protein
LFWAFSGFFLLVGGKKKKLEVIKV